MAPNEAAILNNYLLVPAQLPNIVTLQEFTSFFPKSQQSSPRVRALYRDLQQQRGAVVEAVSEGIAAQVHQGKALRRQVVRERREAEQDEQDDEIEIERTVCFTSGLCLCLCLLPMAMAVATAISRLGCLPVSACPCARGMY